MLNVNWHARWVFFSVDPDLCQVRWLLFVKEAFVQSKYGTLYLVDRIWWRTNPYVNIRYEPPASRESPILPQSNRVRYQYKLEPIYCSWLGLTCRANDAHTLISPPLFWGKNMPALFSTIQGINILNSRELLWNEFNQGCLHYRSQNLRKLTITYLSIWIWNSRVSNS